MKFHVVVERFGAPGEFDLMYHVTNLLAAHQLYNNPLGCAGVFLQSQRSRRCQLITVCTRRYIVEIMAETVPAPPTVPAVDGGKKKTGASAGKKAGSGKKSASSAAAATAVHPKYNDMVKQALVNLKQRGGSSRLALLKYIMQNFDVGKDEKVVNTHLKMALKAGVKNSTLKQTKGSGASGSFRLGETEKKSAAGAVKKGPKKSASANAASTDKKAKKSRSPAKKTSNKKVAKISKPAVAKKSPAKKPAAAAAAKVVKSKPAKQPKAAPSATAKKAAPANKTTAPVSKKATKKATTAGKKTAAAKK